MRAHLLIEHPVSFIDVCDIAFVFVVSLPREFLFLVDAIGHNIKLGIGRTDSVFTYSALILPMTLSIASSLGLLSAYSKLFASRYRLSAASRCSTLVGRSYKRALMSVPVEFSAYAGSLRTEELP
jgi:hypothetical protein